MRFRDYFTNEFETREDHEITTLRSRYYRCKGDEAMEAIKKLATELKAEIKNFDVERKEVMFENGKYTVMVMITNPMYIESAIDFKVMTYSIIPMGKGKKAIEKFYEYLDKILPFKGVGLYKGRY